MCYENYLLLLPLFIKQKKDDLLLYPYPWTCRCSNLSLDRISETQNFRVRWRFFPLRWDENTLQIHTPPLILTPINTTFYRCSKERCKNTKVGYMWSTQRTEGISLLRGRKFTWLPRQNFRRKTLSPPPDRVSFTSFDYPGLKLKGVSGL